VNAAEVVRSQEHTTAVCAVVQIELSSATDEKRYALELRERFPPLPLNAPTFVRGHRNRVRPATVTARVTVPVLKYGK
jgi:hypothetical protein